MRDALAGLARRVQPGLERVEALCERVGLDKQALGALGEKTIQVVGTNGKGSVVAFLASILGAAGKTVHRYTSPHLWHVCERVWLGSEGGGGSGGHITEEAWVALVEEVRGAGVEEASWFEVITVAALLAFHRVPADVVVLEAGLGGRLDATSVVGARLVVLTQVGLDHQAYLGNTLTQVAREKVAAVVKGGRLVVSAGQGQAVKKVVHEAKVEAWWGGKDFWVRKQGEGCVYGDRLGEVVCPRVGLVGAHQRRNLGAAVAAARWWGAVAAEAVATEAVATGIAEVRQRARLERKGRLWVDAAHNPQGARALCAFFGEKKVVVVCGLAKTKDARGFLQALAPVMHKLVAVPRGVQDADGGEEGLAPEDLAEVARGLGVEAQVAKSVAAGMSCALESWEGEVLVCGSFMVCAEALRCEALRCEALRR